MHVEAILSLMRMSREGDPVVSNLASTVLTLVEALREAERRAALAELALETAQVGGVSRR